MIFRYRYVVAVIVAVAALFIARGLGASIRDAIVAEFVVYVLVVVVTEIIRYRRFKRWMREQ